MCRLFGILSTEKVDAARLLYKAPQSLVMQSQVDRKRLQGDGWGIGWFEKNRPRISKSPRPLFKDGNRFRIAARQAKGECLIGHVRWASNPLKLAKSELIGPDHTQPFTHGRWIFAHNGTLFIPQEATAALGPFARFLKGRNDSEVLFYWLLKYLQPSSIETLESGWKKALAQLEIVWKGCLRRYPLFKHPYHGLNWVLSDGKMLVASCWVNPEGFDQGKALCSSGQPYYQLCYRVTPQDVLVASEPLDTNPGWQTLRHGELLLARRTKDGLRVQLKLTVPSKRR